LNLGAGALEDSLIRPSLEVINRVDDSAAKFSISGALARQAMAIQGAWRQPQEFGGLSIVQELSGNADYFAFHVPLVSVVSDARGAPEKTRADDEALGLPSFSMPAILR
jgi:hypothetical protein